MAHGLPAAGQQAMTAKDIEATDLGDGIFMLKGRGGNLGVLTGPDGTFVIDSQFADISVPNLSKIAGLEGSADGLRFLVNTHWHGDHVGGNAAFAAAGATVIAHEGVLRRMSSDQTRDMGGETRTTPAADESAWPVIMFEEGLRLRLNGQSIRVTHLPRAHTDGDAIIIFEEANVIHAGDVLFSGTFPFIDLDSGGTVDGYVEGLETIIAAADADTRIIPGHGPLSTREDVIASRDMIVQTRELIRAEVGLGRTLDEILAANPLADWSEAWSWNFISTERFTTTLYRDAVAVSQ